MGRVLIAEDEENIREVLLRALRTLGHSVKAVADGDQAAQALALQEFDLVITDIRMPGRDGLALLDLVKETTQDTAVMLMTAFGSVENAVEAMKRGADDYIVKPFRLDELEVKVGKIFSERQLHEHNRLLTEQANAQFGRMVGQSPAMTSVYTLIEQVAGSEATVLITGETGTGKELVAHTVHQLSARAQGPFIAVHCAAYSKTLIESELFGHERGSFTGATAQRKGRLELAHNGTLFLDELGEIPPEIQVKLLRFLENKTFERVGGNETISVNVRVVAATHRDLATMVRDGQFREDLFWRLNVFPIQLPPLRERGTDILVLAHFFLEKKSQDRPLMLSKFSEKLLMEYPWPGNVRELQNIIERATLLSPGDTLRVETALTRPHDETKLGDHNLMQILENVEKRLIKEALAQCDGVQAQAAKILGIQRSTLQYKLQKYHLDSLQGGN